MNRTWYKGLGAALVLALGTATPAAAADEPAWVKEWRALAAQTGNPDYATWADRLAKPESLKLVEDWTAFRGYSARGLMAEANLPPDLKPGLEITKDNIAQYPWIAEYLPKPSLDRLMSTGWFKWHKIRIVPTTPYTMSRGRLAATIKARDNGEAFSINDKGELLTKDGQFALLASAALPFTKPKNGLELYWAFLAHGIGNDQGELDPLILYSCKPDNSLDRSYRVHVWWQKMHGRTDVVPLGSIPAESDVVEAGSMVVLSPRDVKGLSATRRRYASADRPDQFVDFLPTMKRVRVMSGSDAQSPMTAGVEMTWDEWRQTWMKPNPAEFEFKIVGEKFILAQPEVGDIYDPAHYTDSKCEIDTIDLELRPVWVLDVNDVGGRYIYKKRRLYIDKEFWYAQYQEMYDARSNLYRMIDDARAFLPETGLWGWRNYVLWNVVTQRANRLDMTSVWSVLGKDMSPYFDIDTLRDY